MADRAKSQVTVTEAKRKIAELLEDLQRQGIWIRGVAITWSTEVKPVDQPTLEAETKCSLKFEADL